MIRRSSSQMGARPNEGQGSFLPHGRWAEAGVTSLDVLPQSLCPHTGPPVLKVRAGSTHISSCRSPTPPPGALRCFSPHSQIVTWRAPPHTPLPHAVPPAQPLTWLPSLADTSAMLFLRAWCMVSAARVAPPATLTMHWWEQGGGRSEWP